MSQRRLTWMLALIATLLAVVAAVAPPVSASQVQIHFADASLPDGAEMPPSWRDAPPGYVLRQRPVRIDPDTIRRNAQAAFESGSPVDLVLFHDVTLRVDPNPVIDQGTEWQPAWSWGGRVLDAAGTTVGSVSLAVTEAGGGRLHDALSARVLAPQREFEILPVDREIHMVLEVDADAPVANTDPPEPASTALNVNAPPVPASTSTTLPSSAPTTTAALEPPALAASTRDGGGRPPAALVAVAAVLLAITAISLCRPRRTSSPR